MDACCSHGGRGDWWAHQEPAATVAGLVARPLPFGELARLEAQLGCDRGLHQRVPLRVHMVPFAGGANVLGDTPT